MSFSPQQKAAQVNVPPSEQCPIESVAPQLTTNRTEVLASGREAASEASDAVTDGWPLISLGSSKHNKIAKNIGLPEFYEQIKKGKYEGAIACIRKHYQRVLAETGDPDKATKAVSKMKAALPGALISGTFETRCANGLIEHSGRACIDLDKIDDRLPEIRERLLTSPYLEAFFLSPTVTGLKVVCRIPADAARHKANYAVFDAYVRELCDLEKKEVDQKCKDVSRLCYMSHDPDLFYNPNAIEFPGAVKSGAEPEQAKQDETRPAPDGDKQKVVSEIFDVIEWLGKDKALVECPGKHKHNNANADTDCTVFLDKTPNVYCHHNSCANDVEAAALLLRKRIENGVVVLPEVFSILDLPTPIADDPNTLLGDRFLCRAAGLLISGPMHSGKSTLLIQLAMHWTIGRTCLEINPAGPLKILYIQSENDKGDMAEMRDVTAACLGEITETEREQLRENFIGSTVFSSGKRAIAEIEALVRMHRPDLLLIDPALSFIGGDNKEQTVVGQFLRNHLDPVLHDYGCAAIVAHHHNKPGKDGSRKMLDYEAAYMAAGSAEWANWPRASLSLTVKDNHGLREITCGKRARKLNWKDANGAHTAKKLVRMGDRVFTELSPEDALVADSKADPMDKILRMPGVLPEEGTGIEKQTLIARIADRKICGQHKARGELIPLLIDDGFLTERTVPRTTGRHAIELVRTAKQWNVVSFKGG